VSATNWRLYKRAKIEPAAQVDSVGLSSSVIILSAVLKYLNIRKYIQREESMHVLIFFKLPLSYTPWADRAYRSCSAIPLLLD